MSVCPSPKSQAYDTIVPSESVEREASKRIGQPDGAALALTENAAIGGKFTVISDDVAFAVRRLSTTVSTTENRPERTKAWPTTTPFPLNPSPKSHSKEMIVPSGSREASAANSTRVHGSE